MEDWRSYRPRSTIMKPGSGLPITNKKGPTCHSCRTKRTRCDRNKPKCKECTTRGSDCVYHPENVSKWTGKQGTRPTACQSCRIRKRKCGETTPGCTARAEGKVHSSPTNPAGSEFPPNDVTTNTTDDTAICEPQASTRESMVAQSIPEASQAKYDSEDEATRIMRREGGVVIDWVEKEIAESTIS
jgi:hypothetical protein